MDYRRQYQETIEDHHSRKNIRRMVAEEVDITSTVFSSCCGMVYDYLNGKYYDSKQARTMTLYASDLTINDIVTELFIAVLPIDGVSPIQSVVAQLGNRLGYKHQLDGVKTASEIIAVCEDSNLYTIWHAKDVENDTGTLAIRPNYKLSDETLRAIRRTMYLPPMLCHPRKWRSNTNGGYLEGSGSVILGAMNHHEQQQDLDSINKIQNIAWELNHHMVEKIETPNNYLDTDEKVEQFEIFKMDSRSVYEALMGAGNEFYFVWKYDKRGRMYSQGYHVNLQGTEYKKAILQFKNKELLQE